MLTCQHRGVSPSPCRGVQPLSHAAPSHTTCNLLIISLCLLVNHTFFFPPPLLFHIFQLLKALKQPPSLADNITIVLLTYCRSSESFCYLAGRAQRSRRYQMQLSQYLAVWLGFASAIHLRGKFKGLGEGRKTNRINPLNSLCRNLAPCQSFSRTNGQCFSLIALSKITNHNVG